MLELLLNDDDIFRISKLLEIADIPIPVYRSKCLLFVQKATILPSFVIVLLLYGKDTLADTYIFQSKMTSRIIINLIIQ